MIQKFKIKNMNIAVVDRHNEVLKIWADLKRDNKNIEYNLLTFDTHTDFNVGFTRYVSNLIASDELKREKRIELLENIKNIFDKKNEFDSLVDVLLNDEHIDVSIKCDIVKKAFAITWNNRNDSEERSIYNVTEKCYLDSSEYFEKSFEDKFLSPQLKEIEKILNNQFFKEKYILDIDLDYFYSYTSVNPKEKEIFYKLIKNAEIITIAKEEMFLIEESCRLGPEILRVDTLLERLKDHIESAL